MTSDVWRVSASLSAARLLAITMLSIGLTAVSLVVGHGRCERGGGGRASDQVLLFNATTAVTVVLGVVSLYLALLVLTSAGAGLLITPDALSRAIATDVGLSDYLKLAWFVIRWRRSAGHWEPASRQTSRSAKLPTLYRGEDERGP